jgi:hypothetical protein
VAIASPVGLKIALSGIPAAFGSRLTVPVDHVNVGRVALGNADGFAPDLILEHSNTLLYPIPDSMTLVGLTLSSPVTAIITELLAAPVANSALQPWDRGAALWTQTAFQFLTAVNTGAVAWSYTVPAGKVLMLASAEVRMVRTAVATVVASVQAYIQAGGNTVVVIVGNANVLGEQVADSLTGGPLYLPAGTVVTANYSCNESTGGHYVWMNAAGLLFNA